MTKIKYTIKKIIAGLTAFCMIFSMIPSITYAETSSQTSNIVESADKFHDVSGHWALKSINKWAGLGLLNGDEKGFRPNDSITRAEMAVILNNLMGYQVKASNQFQDLNGDEWYADALLKVNNAGILNGDGAGHANPKANISREEAALMLARVFAVEPGIINETSFKDADKISSWAKDLVFGMEADKYIGGMEIGKFEPKANVTRAQVVTMIDNAVKAYYTTAGTYTENILPEKPGANCLVIVKSGGVNLKDCKISGDIIIAEGVGDGDFTLDGTKVTGKLIVRGGGVNSIYIINGSEVNGNISVERKDGVIRIVTNGVTIKTLSANTKVVLEGKFTNITVAKDAEVEVKGEVDNVLVESKATVFISKNSEVKSLIVAKAAEGSNINISGNVAYLKTEASNTKIIADSTSKIQNVEAAETAGGTNVSIDKNAYINSFKSSADVTISGEGTLKEISGTGSIIYKETGKKVEINPIIVGGFVGVVDTSPIIIAENAVYAYENAPITTLEQITSTEGLKISADATISAISDETQKKDFELRIYTRTAAISEAKIKLEEIERAKAKIVEAEVAVSKYETATIITLAEVSQAEILESTANEKVALLATGATKLALENRIASKKALVEAVKEDLNAIKDSEMFKTSQAIILNKTTETIVITEKDAVNGALTEYVNLSEMAKAKLNTEKALLDSLLAKIEVLETIKVLKEATDKASALSDYDYTTDSWEKLEDALYEPEDTLEKIILKISTINTAMAGLRFAGQDKLDIVIVTVKNLKQADYSIEKWILLETAIAMPETTNVEVNNKAIEINNAIKNLGVVTVESLYGTIYKLFPGVYNISLNETYVKSSFVGITKEKLIITIDVGKTYEAIYSVKLNIGGAGWIAYNIQGYREEIKLRAAIVTMAE